MKKQILAAAFCACLALTACKGGSKQGTSDSSSVSQDSAGTGTGNGSGAVGAGTDTAGGSQANGAPTSAGAAAGDSSYANPDTAAKSVKH